MSKLADGRASDAVGRPAAGAHRFESKDGGRTFEKRLAVTPSGGH
ncbi:hypothetical protein ACH4GM_05320 [Streptomyces coeruleorubidus]